MFIYIYIHAYIHIHPPHQLRPRLHLDPCPVPESRPPRGPPPWRIGLVPGRSRRRSDPRPTRTPPGSLKKTREISGNINEYQ